MLRELGDCDRALEQFDRVLCHEQDHADEQGNADAHFNRSLALLQSGRLAEGWSEYRWRWRCAAAEPACDFFPQPQWDGSPLAGKHVLDSCRAVLRRRDPVCLMLWRPAEQAASCSILCDPRLHRLFERSFPKAHIRRRFARSRSRNGKRRRRGRADLQIAGGDLPRHCRATTDSFPQRGAYLTADLARTKFWRERYATLGPGIKVGIAWRDTAAHVVARHQAPELRLWRPLLSLPGIQWIGLLDSPEDRRESASVAKEQGVVVRHFPEAEAVPDLDEFAARVAALDVAIVVGGLPAHLAGALDTPTYVLAVPSDWQWLSTPALQHRGIGRCGSSGPIEPGGAIRFCGSVRNCSSNTWLRPTNSRWAPSGVPIGRRPRWRHLPESRRTGSVQQASE